MAAWLAGCRWCWCWRRLLGLYYCCMHALRPKQLLTSMRSALELKCSISMGRREGRTVMASCTRPEHLQGAGQKAVPGGVQDSTTVILQCRAATTRLDGAAFQPAGYVNHPKAAGTWQRSQVAAAPPATGVPWGPRRPTA